MLDFLIQGLTNFMQGRLKLAVAFIALACLFLVSAHRAEAGCGLSRGSLRFVARPRIVAAVHAPVIAAIHAPPLAIVSHGYHNNAAIIAVDRPQIILRETYVSEPLRSYTTVDVNDAYVNGQIRASRERAELQAQRDALVVDKAKFEAAKLVQDLLAGPQTVRANLTSPCDQKIAELRAEVAALKQSLVK